MARQHPLHPGSDGDYHRGYHKGRMDARRGVQPATRDARRQLKRRAAREGNPLPGGSRSSLTGFGCILIIAALAGAALAILALVRGWLA